MTTDNRKWLRHEVEHGGWIIIWAAANMPNEFLDEPVELIYKDMDGRPAICDAIYTYDRRSACHSPYFQRSDGARMVNCIAWRYREKDTKGA